MESHRGSVSSFHLLLYFSILKDSEEEVSETLGGINVTRWIYSMTSDYSLEKEEDEKRMICILGLFLYPEAEREETRLGGNPGNHHFEQ